MQQTFSIPIQGQTKFELKSKSQEVSMLKAKNLHMTVDAFSSLLLYSGHSDSGRIQQC